MAQRNISSSNQDQQAQFQPQPNANRVSPVAEPMTSFAPPHQPGNYENALPYGMAQYNAIHHPPNYYPPYATSPGSGVFPPQGPQFFNGFGGGFKRKGAEGHHGNFPYMTGSSSAGPSTQNPNHLMPVQALVPAGAPWLGQQFSGNSGDGSSLAWGQAPAMPFMQGMGNMVTETNIISTNFQPLPPPMYPQIHPQSLHHLPQPVQLPFYPQVQSTSYVLPRNNAIHTNVNAYQVGTEVGPTYVGPVPPGVAVYHPSLGRAALRRHALPRFNFFPADEVAMLEIPGYHEIGNAVDNHRDMRMDVDSMSYEELLALEEHIGSVTVGLSEEAISNHLKTRTHIASTNSVELEDRETDFCTICQHNYEDQHKIGTLDCDHEFHVDCIKKWLVIKNICPICKSSALTTKRSGSNKDGS